MAAVTQESIPPLNKTTALGFLLIILGVKFLFTLRCNSGLRSLYAAGGRMPYEFMQLWTEPHGQAVSQNPFRNVPGTHPRPDSLRIGVHGGKYHLMSALGEAVLPHKVPRKFV